MAADMNIERKQRKQREREKSSRINRWQRHE